MADYAITLNGFTFDESYELRTLIKATNGVKGVGFVGRTRDAVSRLDGESIGLRSDIQIVVDLVRHSLLKTAVLGLLSPAAMKASSKFGETLGDLLSKWLHDRFPGPAGRAEAEVKLFGPGGALIKHVNATR